MKFAIIFPNFFGTCIKILSNSKSSEYQPENMCDCPCYTPYVPPCTPAPYCLPVSVCPSCPEPKCPCPPVCVPCCPQPCVCVYQPCLPECPCCPCPCPCPVSTCKKPKIRFSFKQNFSSRMAKIKKIAHRSNSSWAVCSLWLSCHNVRQVYCSISKKNLV